MMPAGLATRAREGVRGTMVRKQFLAPLRDCCFLSALHSAWPCAAERLVDRGGETVQCALFAERDGLDCIDPSMVSIQLCCQASAT